MTACPVRVAESWHPDGGWSFVAALSRIEGGRAVAVWGGGGWDLGDWPRVVYGHMRTDDGFALAELVDGDVTVTVFRTRLDLIEATDQVAERWWRHNPDRYRLTGVLDKWPQGELPDHFRGPFNRSAREWWRAARTRRGAR